LDRMLSSCFERLHSLEPLLLLKTVWSIWGNTYRSLYVT
jgi:hypothetical protein